MVVGQGKVHDWSSYYLVTSYNWSVDDRMHAQDGTLRWVDDGSTHERAKSATVWYGEASSLHVLDCYFSVSSLLCQMSKTLNTSRYTSSKSWNFMFWQFLRTGTSSPLGVATATEISMKFLLITSFPSMTELMIGYSCKARAAAFMKNDMKPSLIPYFFRKSSPSYWVNAEVPFWCWLLRTCPPPGR